MEQSKLSKKTVDLNTLYDHYLNLPGKCGGSLLFDPHEGHFYRFSAQQKYAYLHCCSLEILRWEKSNMCKSRFKIIKDHRCTKVRGENHHHDVPGRSFVEFYIFCWACKLHTAKHPGKETPGRIVKQLASTWPLPLPGNRQELKKILLSFSRSVKKDPQKAQEFQNRFGNEHLVRFINLLEKQQPYWLVPPLPPKTNGQLSERSDLPRHRFRTEKLDSHLPSRPFSSKEFSGTHQVTSVIRTREKKVAQVHWSSRKRSAVHTETMDEPSDHHHEPSQLDSSLSSMGSCEAQQGNHSLRSKKTKTSYDKSFGGRHPKLSHANHVLYDSLRARHSFRTDESEYESSLTDVRPFSSKGLSGTTRATRHSEIRTRKETAAHPPTSSSKYLLVFSESSDSSDEESHRTDGSPCSSKDSFDELHGNHSKGSEKMKIHASGLHRNCSGRKTVDCGNDESDDEDEDEETPSAASSYSDTKTSISLRSSTPDNHPTVSDTENLEVDIGPFITPAQNFSAKTNSVLPTTTTRDWDTLEYDSAASIVALPTTSVAGHLRTNALTPPDPLETGSILDNVRKPIEPPSGLKVDFVTTNTAQLSWTAQHYSFFYRTNYWPKGQPMVALSCTSMYNKCDLELLDPETTYTVSVMSLSEDGLHHSASSMNIELTTAAVNARYAEMLRLCSEKIGKENGMALYSVPLANLTPTGSSFDRFVFGKADSSQKERRTVLLVGASGSGKTTLINAMVNYVFNVKWEDNFRFQLIQKRTSNKSRIAVFEINHAEGFRIPYSLTIVTTPGYFRNGDLENDREITEMIRKCFNQPNGIRQLDMVGFVAQSFLLHGSRRTLDMQKHIFNSLLSIFGDGIKTHIHFLITFADNHVPPILEFIAEAGLPFSKDDEIGQPVHKFNSPGFFCSNRQSGDGAVDKFDRSYWRMTMGSFHEFFLLLSALKPLLKPLSTEK